LSSPRIKQRRILLFQGVSDEAFFRSLLGDGTHRGDFIEVSLLEALQRELDILVAETEHSRSNYVEEFVLQMRELVRTARAENNPIYFG